MNRRFLAGVPLVCFAFVMHTTAQAGDTSSWKGELVVGKRPPSKITFGDHVGDKEVFFKFKGDYPIKVRDERDGWLRLFDGHREGWADKDQFVLSRDATAYFTDRIKADPSDIFAWASRGIAWDDLGEFDNAIKDFTECIRLDPKSAISFNSRGIAWSAKKEYDRAIRDYDEAIRLDPEFALSWANRGNLWRAKKEYDRAIKDYDEAIRIDPKLVAAYQQRGDAWRDKQDYDRAIKDYDEAIRLDPKYPAAFKNRGYAVWRAKKGYDRAIKDYNEAIRLDPKLVWSHYLLSVTQMLMRRPGAVAGFQRVLDLQGWKGELSPYAVILGHLAARQMGDGAAAKRFLKNSTGKLDEAWPYPAVKFLRNEIDEPALLKSADDDNKRTEAHCYLGLDCALKDRKDEALAHFRWVKEHGDPQNVQYAIALAELERLERLSSGSKP
jgi:lipoprotein NlpI